MTVMDEQQILFHLILQQLSFSQHRYYASLWQRCNNLEQLFQITPSELSQALPKAALDAALDLLHKKQNSKIYQQARHDLEWIQHNQITVVSIQDTCYPSLLKTIHNPPPVLMLKGNASLLDQQQIGIVGSRKSSPAGLQFAYEFAETLAQQRFCINSGLALGIDAQAHRGALAAAGNTIAVIATGIDICYPYRHKQLIDEIGEHGLIISEFPLTTPAKRENFPRRNRIISGLSIGILVVEAELQSGSLITARYALEQGREVWAIPGSPKYSGAQGCNALIRTGATLVEKPDDILQDVNLLDWTLARIQANPTTSSTSSTKQRQTIIESVDQLDEQEQHVYGCLNFESKSVDSLIEDSGLSYAQLSALLLNLELRGLIAMMPGGYCRV